MPSWVANNQQNIRPTSGSCSVPQGTLSDPVSQDPDSATEHRRRKPDPRTGPASEPPHWPPASSPGRADAGGPQMREVQWAPGHIGTCTKSLDSSALPSLAITPLRSRHDGSYLAENCQRSVSTTTTLADGFLGWTFFLNRESWLISLDTQDPELLWEAQVNAEVVGSPRKHPSLPRPRRYTSTAFMLMPLDSPGPSRTVQCQGVPIIPFQKCSPVATSTNLSSILTSGEKAVGLEINQASIMQYMI